MQTDSLGRRLLLFGSILLAALVVLGGGTSSFRRIASFQPIGFAAERADGNWLVSGAGDGLGLETGDQILLVNGDSFARTPQLREALRGQAQSELLVLRGDELVDVGYVLPPLEIDFAYLVLALIGCAYLLVGFYTLLRDQRTPAVVFFLWALTSAIVYLFSPTSPFDLVDKVLYVAEEFARILLAPLTLHLFTIFPRPLGQEGKARRIVPFYYLPATFLALLQLDLIATGGRNFFGESARSALAALDRLELIHLVIFGLAAAAVLGWRLWSTRQHEAKRQTTWMVFGLAGGYLPFALLYALPRSFGATWPETLAPFTVTFLAIVPVAFSYAILRYRLWDLGVLVRDAASLSLTVLIGVSGFALANLVVNRLVPTDLALGRNVLVFISGLTIASLMVPTRRNLGRSLERLHYRGRFGQRRALAEIGQELLNERDLSNLCERLTAEVAEGLDIQPSNLLLLQYQMLVPWLHEPELEEPLAVEELPESLWSERVHSLPALGLPDQHPAELRLFGAGYRYALPLTVRNRKIGLFVCGYKESGVPLNSEDLDLVRSLLNQAALAIENAQLIEQVKSQLDEVVELQRFNQEIIESSPAGIVVLDESNRIVSLNRAFARLVARVQNDCVGLEIGTLIPRSSLPSPGDGLRETSYEDSDGAKRYLQLSAGELAETTDSGNRVLVVQDVTERVALEGALKEKDRLASLGVLAAGVAHEVNTPITGISSYAQMLLNETPVDDPRHQILKKVETQTFRAARIVNNLLNLARKRSGERVPVDLVPLMKECLDLLHERMHDKQVRLHWDPAPKEVLVIGNDGELQQVFTNLAMNAIDAMRETGGSLTVDIETNEKWAWIGVEDTGPGIALDKLENIFEPFYSTKLDQGGTGLGLSISHDLIKRHGGDIRVISNPGEGCRFVVELPIERPESHE